MRYEHSKSRFQWTVFEHRVFGMNELSLCAVNAMPIADAVYSECKCDNSLMLIGFADNEVAKRLLDEGKNEQ